MQQIRTRVYQEAWRRSCRAIMGLASFGLWDLLARDFNAAEFARSNTEVVMGSSLSEGRL